MKNYKKLYTEQKARAELAEANYREVYDYKLKLEEIINKAGWQNIEGISNNGLYTISAPCKVGDTVYYIRAAMSKNPHEPKIEVGTVLKIIVTKSGIRLALSMNSVYENSINSIGKSIFFDEQEANEAIENLKQRMK